MHAQRDELRTILEQELEALPGEFRMVFVMRDVEDMTVDEAAEILGIPPATVRSRAFRARRLLRDRLARVLDGVMPEVYEFGGKHCDRVVATVLARLRSEA